VAVSRPLAPGLAVPPAGPLEARLRLARSLVARHRRLGAALCAGAAVLAALSSLTAPPAPSGTPDEAAGAAGIASLLPPGAGLGPAGGSGRVAVTVRLADPAGALLLAPGLHVEVVGGAPAGSGAATGGAQDVAVLAADAVVLGVPARTSGPPVDGGGLLGAAGGDPGGSATGTGLDGVVVLSVPPADAHRLAGAAGTRPLSVAVALPRP
jgi:hypothetical protein